MTTEEKKEYKAWLKEQSREQLEIALEIAENSEEKLQKKLFLLAGCPKFGDYDSLDGRCVDCVEDNFTLSLRCRNFQTMVRLYNGIPQKEKDNDCVFFNGEF